MAITGAGLMLFVIAHLLGNLQVFLGPDVFNNYAATLQSLPELLWPARIGLLALVSVHLALAFQLRNINKGARPRAYGQQNTIQAAPSSLYMLETGIVILIFVVIHLLHFTFGALQPEFFHAVDPKGRHDVYSVLIHGFQNRLYAGTYLFCMAMLGVHLSHAVTSMLQTLGLPTTRDLRRVGRFVGYGIALGYSLIPIAVQLGLLHLASKGVSI